MKYRWSPLLLWVLLLASLASLGLWLRSPGGFFPDWTAIALGAGIIAFLVHFPIPVGQVQINLSHAISLTLGMALGPGAAGLSLAIGLTIGDFSRSIWSRYRARLPQETWKEVRAWALTLSRQLLSLFGSMAVYLMIGGRPLITTRAIPPFLPSIGLALSFVILFFALHWIDHLIIDSPTALFREFLTPLLVTTAPVPFAIIGAASFAHMQHTALAFFGLIAMIVSPIVRNLVIAERDLNRRLQELSTINRVSQAMRTSLNLDALLTTIYLQVAHLLQVNNFYIAFHDPDEDMLSYPLAVKHGSRQEWARRDIANRLTDHVIRTATPLLIPREAPQMMVELGFPETDNPPQAWLGVPLLNPERAIGCLAVFHTSPDKSFSQKDQDVLVTLAGQASVAIDNALLYEQTRNRAQALTSLNQITASMSSSLDPERTLELVCLSINRVGGGDKSAIFLLDEEQSQLFLARSTNLSDEFASEWRTISIEDPERMQAITSQAPVLIPNVSGSHQTENFRTQLLDEGVGAYADLPLITPSGIIGQLSVYFKEPQHFHDEQIELLKIFAAQAALAVANARAHAATDQALQRRVDQLATLETIGRTMIATLDMPSLFETILDNALRVTNAAIGHLAIYEVESHGLRVVAHHAYPKDSPIIEDSWLMPTDQGIPGRAFQSGEVCNVPAVSEDPSHQDWSGGITQSMLSVPILRQETVLGVVTVESSETSAFSSEHEQFLIQLAAQAAVAIANATLYHQLEARLREQSLLYQASTQIAASFESEAVALAVADSLAVALSIEGASISRWDPESNTLRVQTAVHNGRPINTSTSTTVSLDEVPTLALCVKEGKPFQWTLDDAPSEPDKRHLLDFHKARSILVVPLIAGEHTLGLIEAYSQQVRSFDENAIRTAQTIASQAAIALENTDLFRRISESHNLLSAILNSTREGMLMVDTSGNILLANDQLEALTGLPVARLIGRSLLAKEFNAANLLGYRSGELSNVITALQRRQVLIGEVTTFDIQRPDYRAMQRSEAPVRDADGSLIGWLIVLRDVTEERELNEAREQLTEMIVHDLRSPLTAILGSLKLLDGIVNEDDHSPVMIQALSVSKRSVQQMLGLVNSLLDIAKLESGELELNLQSISLKSLCEELVGTYVHEANNGGIILECNINKRVPRMKVDEEKMRRVLINLLDNALKFTPAGGRVALEVKRKKDGVILTVVDTGPGVPEEYREQIFDRFGEVPGIAGRRRGTGLGLAFSKLAVDTHGGKIWVEGNPGGGSAFHIFLPRIP